MLQIRVLIIATVLIFILAGCSNESSTNPPTGNTIMETSFESDGKFYTNGWTLTSLSDSSTDVPPDGGNFSLKLKAGQPPEVYAEMKIPVSIMANEYRFSFWSRYSTIQGKAILSLIRNGASIKSRSIQIDEIVWRSFSITDTFSVAAGDSFLVQLTGGFSQLLSGETYFDLCRLEAIE